MSNDNSEQFGNDEVAGERTLPSVGEEARSNNQRGLIIIGLFVLVAFFIILAFFKLTSGGDDGEKKEEPPEFRISSRLPEKTFTAPPALPKPEPKVEVPAPAPPLPAPVIQQPIVIQAPPPLPGGNAQFLAQNKPEKRPLDKSASGLMGAGANDPSKQALEQLEQINAQVATQQAGAGGNANFFGGETPPPPTGLSAALVSSSTETRKAKMLGNRNFILAKGSFIDCGMQTRLDSTVPGFTSCVVTRNVYSDNGKVLLVERGSLVTGEYQSNVQHGQARIFVLWNRIKTPHGVVIDLDSAGTDSLGGSGVPGYVDSHFFKRFGGAILLSMIDDLARAASSRGNGTDVNFNSSGEAASDVASQALEATIDIPPTLYVNQGEQVGIFVSRDLDFSEVYGVESR